MVTAIAYDEDTIKILLLGDEDEITRGVEKFHEAKCGHICRIIQNANRYLDRHGIEDVYQDTIVILLEKAKSRDYDAKGDLIAYVGRIAKNKARDHYRRAEMHKKHADAIAKAIEDRLRLTDIGRQWSRKQSEERTKFNIIVNRVIDSLPKIQRAVTIAWIDVFPAMQWQLIASAASRLANHHITIPSAKSAWAEAERKLRSAWSGEGSHSSGGML